MSSPLPATSRITGAMFYVILVAAAAAAFFFIRRWWMRREMRRHLLATPLSRAQRKVVQDQVPLVRKLPPELRQSLEGKINVFLTQVEFQGCDGLEVTPEMELSIAAQACLLVVNTDAWYDHLTTVMIYPGAFKSVTTRQDGYVVTQEEVVRLGESWSRGPVILSWQHTQAGAADEGDGRNVAFHEFAHQIDGLSGHTDGAPVLAKDQTYTTWEQVILDAYGRHVARTEQGQQTVLDAYGTTAHEEFFAVAVEVFFEKPLALARDEPDLYAQLSKLFRLDPKSWT